MQHEVKICQEPKFNGLQQEEKEKEKQENKKQVYKLPNYLREREITALINMK